MTAAVTGGVGLAGQPARAGALVAIRVNPEVTYAPANLWVRAEVEARPENRRLEITAESAEFFRSSEVQLDGKYAPRVSFFQFHSLPAGDYIVTASVRDEHGGELASTESKATVMGGVER